MFLAVCFVTRPRDTAMKENVGKIDRIIRVVVGLALLSLVFVGPQTAWGWIGLLALATGVAGWCPAYSLLGVSTCPRRA